MATTSGHSTDRRHIDGNRADTAMSDLTFRTKGKRILRYSYEDQQWIDVAFIQARNLGKTKALQETTAWFLQTFFQDHHILAEYSKLIGSQTTPKG